MTKSGHVAPIAENDLLLTPTALKLPLKEDSLEETKNVNQVDGLLESVSKHRRSAQAREGAKSKVELRVKHSGEKKRRLPPLGSQSSVKKK